MDAGELMHRLARSAIRLAIRLPGKLLAALLGVFLLVGPLAAPVSAHAQLQSTTPQAGARLDRPPGAISIRFDEKVTAAAGGIRVYDAAAKRIPTDSTTSTGTSMTIRLPDLADGAYVVVWQAVSVDGHPVRGSLTFQVGDGDQATVTAFGEQQLANASTDSTVRLLMGLLRLLLFGSTALLIAAVAWRIALVSLPPSRIVSVAGVIAALAAFATLLVDGPYGQGQGLTTVGFYLVDESLSKVTVKAVLGLGIVCLLCSRLLRRDETPTAGLIGALLLIAVLAGSTGHAVAGPNAVGAIVSTGIHVVAASTWAGGLALLLIARRAKAPIDLHRWSSLAQVAVIVIMVTGVANAFRQVGSFEAFRTTGYGRLLAAKLFVVAAMLFLGGWQRKRLASIKPRAVAVETLLGVIVVALSTVLSSTVPARASVSRPISIRVQTNSTRSDVTVDPARLGPNVIHIYVFGLDGTTLPIDDASFELTHLATGTTVEVDPFKAGRGHEQAQGVQLPFTGTWQLVTRIYLSEFEVEQSTSTFQVK